MLPYIFIRPIPMTVYPCRSLTHPIHRLVVTKSPFLGYSDGDQASIKVQSLSRNPLSCSVIGYDCKKKFKIVQYSNLAFTRNIT